MMRKAKRETNTHDESPERIPILSGGDSEALKHATLLFKDLPPWRQDNKHILSGYWQSTASYQDALFSLFHVHIQTCNIYSHLLAIPIIYAQAALFFASTETQGSKEDYIVFGIFIAGVTTCFLLSAAFHTLSSLSAPVHSLWVRMDYVGIVVLKVATFVAGEYYLFFCDATRMYLHFTITTTVGTATIVALLTPRLQTQTYRSFRLLCFCAMELSGFVPMIDSLLHYGWVTSVCYSIVFYLFEMLLELFSAVTYATRIPERWRPGTFDIWGASHQWFHLFSAGAALVHLFGLENALIKTRTWDRCPA